VAGRRLTYEEREEIAWRRDRGEGIRKIARVLGRAPSTISRELKRNISPSPRRYRAFPAHIMARERPMITSGLRLLPCPRLQTLKGQGPGTWPVHRFPGRAGPRL
jgi:IS30 family transposase